MANEHPRYTTTIMAIEALTRGHGSAMSLPGDFMLSPDDTLRVHARFAPARSSAPRCNLPRIQAWRRIRARRHNRHRRADAAQRSLARRPGNAVGGGHRNIVRPRRGGARRARAQRSRQPVAGDQQALFPVLPRSRARRDADHQIPERREGIRQGAWRQDHLEAAAGIGRAERVPGRLRKCVEHEPDDRGDPRATAISSARPMFPPPPRATSASS